MFSHLSISKVLFFSLFIPVYQSHAVNSLPSYCHLPVSCRSLVDRCGSFGSCKPQSYFFFLFYRISMFLHLSIPKVFIFLLYSSLYINPMLLIRFSHFSCYFLHPRFSKFSLSSPPFQNLLS